MIRLYFTLLLGGMAWIANLPTTVKDQSRLEWEPDFFNQVVHKELPRAVPPPRRLLAETGDEHEPRRLSRYEAGAMGGSGGGAVAD